MLQVSPKVTLADELEDNLKQLGDDGHAQCLVTPDVVARSRKIQIELTAMVGTVGKWRYDDKNNADKQAALVEKFNHFQSAQCEVLEMQQALFDIEFKVAKSSRKKLRATNFQLNKFKDRYTTNGCGAGLAKAIADLVTTNQFESQARCPYMNTEIDGLTISNPGILDPGRGWRQILSLGETVAIQIQRNAISKHMSLVMCNHSKRNARPKCGLRHVFSLQNYSKL